jgi:hypothetical protein
MLVLRYVLPRISGVLSEGEGEQAPRRSLEHIQRAGGKAEEEVPQSHTVDPGFGIVPS